MGLPHRPARDLCPAELCANALGEAPVGGWLEGIEETARPELAKRLLFEAGWDGKRPMPPLTLKYFNRPAIQELAVWLQAQWKKNLGIEVKLDGMETKVYWSTLGHEPTALFLNSKGPSYPDPDTYFRLFADKNPQNLGRWSDTDYDGWVKEAGRASEPGARLQSYRLASRRALNEHPALIPLYFKTVEYLVKPFVKNLGIDPLTGVDFSHVEYETARAAPTGE